MAVALDRSYRESVIIHGIEEHDLRAALEVANYAYKGNLCFREEPATLSSPQSWRVRLSLKDQATDAGCTGPGGIELGGTSGRVGTSGRFATMPIGISSTPPLSAPRTR